MHHVEGSRYALTIPSLRRFGGVALEITAWLVLFAVIASLGHLIPPELAFEDRWSVDPSP